LSIKFDLSNFNLKDILKTYSLDKRIKGWYGNDISLWQNV